MIVENVSGVWLAPIAPSMQSVPSALAESETATARRERNTA
jgi:hypothetical protein